MRKYIKVIPVIILCLIFALTFAASAQEAEEAEIDEERIEELKEEVSEDEPSCEEGERLAELQEEIKGEKDKIKSADLNVNASTQLLASLDEPEEKPAIAVLEIADDTGEVTETGSYVVSQGAEDMLITALKRSRQFDVLDRVSDDNIMQEQDLQENNLLAAGEPPQVGELLGADYIITGSVTDYQVDKKSGGTGISIAGLGGSKEYAVASTAIDLRLIDASSGEVVWTRSLRDEIEGERVGVEAFSFMGDNIVELETGQGEQEVINLVLRTLLEEAVFELAESGIN